MTIDDYLITNSASVSKSPACSKSRLCPLPRCHLAARSALVARLARLVPVPSQKIRRSKDRPAKTKSHCNSNSWELICGEADKREKVYLICRIPDTYSLSMAQRNSNNSYLTRESDKINSTSRTVCFVNKGIHYIPARVQYNKTTPTTTLGQKGYFSKPARQTLDWT